MNFQDNNFVHLFESSVYKKDFERIRQLISAILKTRIHLQNEKNFKESDLIRDYLKTWNFEVQDWTGNALSSSLDKDRFPDEVDKLKDFLHQYVATDWQWRGPGEGVDRQFIISGTVSVFT